MSRPVISILLGVFQAPLKRSPNKARLAPGCRRSRLDGRPNAQAHKSLMHWVPTALQAGTPSSNGESNGNAQGSRSSNVGTLLERTVPTLIPRAVRTRPHLSQELCWHSWANTSPRSRVGTLRQHLSHCANTGHIVGGQ